VLSEAKHVAPGTKIERFQALKGRNTGALFRPFRPRILLCMLNQGRRASRLPLAIIFRAFGAVLPGFRDSYFPIIRSHCGMTLSRVNTLFT
jgi:hypothetical protein